MPTPDVFEDITPDDSVVPVFLVPDASPLFDVPEFETADEMIASHQSLKDSALSKLKNFGLSTDEAKAVIGL